MNSKARFQKKNQLSFISIFLAVDILIIFGLLRTSSAVYVADAIGEAPVEVALYAVGYDGLYNVDTSNNETPLEINLGSMGPGDTKYYRFRVSNQVIENNESTRSDTDVIYELKVITTTNIDLEYSLYINQNPLTTGATDYFASGSGTVIGIGTDDFGTVFKHYALPKRCMSKDSDVENVYTLKVVFPNDATHKDSKYQDLVESIKIQVDSEQLVADDSAQYKQLCGY